MTTTCPAPFVDLANRLADASGEVIRRYFRAGVAVEAKPDASPVTAADREAETAIRGLIAGAFPDHGIIGEEHGSERAEARYLWVLDPIDGTKSFVAGVPLFGTLIALLDRGVPILGVVDQPVLGERWLGAAGRPTTLNGAPVRARPCPELDRAILFATSPDMFQGPDGPAFARLQRQVAMVRYGADCYATGLLASGHIDLIVEAKLQPYDFCALIPVIQGAGGVVTDWNGDPLGLESDGHIAAAGDPAAHARVISALSATD